MTRGRYNTHQRAELTDFFASHPDDSFSARQLMEQLGGGMGEATIYRALSALTDEGVIERSSVSGKNTYHYNKKHSCKGHLHLQCLKCSELICTDAQMLEQLDSSLGFEIDGEKTTIFGVCAKCRAANGREQQ